MKQAHYIDGIGWRYETEHRMTRWPDWKDSHLPGTYMFTLNINGGQRLLGRLEGSTNAVRQWMAQHPSEVKAASDDPLYYRHALLANKVMPFVLAESSPLVRRRFNDVAPHPHRKTHFPIPALSQPAAPHIVLSPLGEQVLTAWQRMPKVVPQIEHVCLAIMPNHIHAIIAVHQPLSRAIGAIIRSFMGTTSHTLHKMMEEGTVQWDASAATITRKASADKPSLWSEGFCVGVCQTEEKLHTRIGYVLENPFFGLLEKEQHDFMQRTLLLTIAGRTYGGYGNMLLLKEPDRVQVFCHRQHPVTHEPYHLTHDYRNEKDNILQAAGNGAVIVTPGISPGEADIMWSVLKAGGCVINIQKEEIPINSKWHPEKERRIYCSQGKLLVLSVHDLPHQVFHDRWGQVIPTDSKYARFHLLNLVAAEICAEGIEHGCRVAR